MTQNLPVPENEQERLKALINYNILDTLPDDQLNAITQLASYICKTPIALITLIDSDRQWIKSRHGLDAEETARDVAFCQYTILGDDIMEVPDALEDKRFKDNPYVLDDPNIRFYAGMPLSDPEGHNLGSLCVIDKVPRPSLNEEQKVALRTLSRQVMANFELRKKNSVLQDEINKLATEKIKNIEADLEIYKLEKILSQERILLENKIVSILSENKPRDITVKEITKQICKTMRWDLGAYWDFSNGGLVPDPEREVFNFSGKDMSAFINDTLSLNLIPGQGLIGRVYELKEPVWVSEITSDTYFRRKDSALKSNLRSAFAFPVIFENRVLGVMEFANSETKQSDPFIIDMFKGIGLQLGNFIDRKRTEDELFNLAKIQQSILNSTDYCIIHTDADGIIRTFNSGAEKMLGYKAEDLIGKSAGEVSIYTEADIVRRAAELSEELGYTVEPGLASFVAKADMGIPDTNEWTYVRKDGSTLTALLTVNTIRNENGEIAGHLGISRDITETIESRAQIEIYENVVENMTTGLIVWRLEEGEGPKGYDFSLVTINQAAESVTPFSSKLPGTMMSQVFPTVFDTSPVPAMMRDVVLNQKPVQMPDFKSALSDTYFSVTMFPLPDNSIGTLSHNITPLKKVEEELREAKLIAEKSVVAKDQFLANMSHEIRTPMNAIIGFTELMLQTRLDEEQKDYTNSVKLAGENLLAIINDILDFSKIESGKLAIEEAPFDIRKTLNNVYALLSVKAKNKDISFDFYLDENLPQYVIGDSVRLNQVLVNIVGNAIKFTESGGVTVKAKTIDHADGHAGIFFSVSDTGIGIQDDMKDTVFERFTQANNEIHRKYGGTGLGLSISKNLVSLMGGQLEMKSEYGKGTEFSFVLRFSTVDAAEMHKQKVHVVPVRLDSKAKILLFEDNTLNQKLATKVLNGFGFDVEVAGNGVIGIEMLRHKHYDLTLMDLQMPDMDGYQATAAIRNDLKLDIPIIAMTAHSLVGEKEKCLALGMNEFVSKPFKQEELYSKIKYLLEEAEAKKKQSQDGYSGIVNLNYLRDFSGGDPDFEKEMIGIFLEQVPLDIELLQKAFDAVSYADISATAHKLRSSISIIGRDDLAKHLSLIEKEGKKNHLTTDMENAFDTVKTILSNCYPELQIILENHYN